MEHPLFEIVTTTAGAISIRNKKVNEIMHNPVGPWKEANELYISQSKLAKRLSTNTDREFVVYDVGLGAAANALATLHCAKNYKRPLKLVSFEIDLQLLHFALKHSSQFSHFAGYENAVTTILKEKQWQSDHLSWELLEGDFLSRIQDVQTKCDLIYYDPYSPKMNPEMWTTNCFSLLYEKCNSEAIFYNYSQATPIRAALLEAGFYVGYGIPTGLKQATTQAALRLQDLDKPLDSRWLERWKRSHTPFPFNCTNKEELKDIVINHPQFKL